MTPTSEHGPAPPTHNHSVTFHLTAAATGEPRGAGGGGGHGGIVPLGRSEGLLSYVQILETVTFQGLTGYTRKNFLTLITSPEALSLCRFDYYMNSMFKAFFVTFVDVLLISQQQSTNQLLWQKK